MPRKKKKDIKLSATRISSFLRCKKKYQFQYELHLPKADNDSFKEGLIGHEALEYAGNIWMQNGRFTAKDKEKIMQICDETAIRENVSDLTILAEAKELVKKRIENFGIGRTIIGLEKRFGFEGTEDIITESGVSLVGAFDKVVEVDDDTLLIIDYKTSKTAPTPDQLKTDLQLSIYDVAASIKYPQYKRIVLALDMLKHDLLYTYRTPEERREFADYLTVLYTQMLTFEEKDAIARPNIFCGWCDYRDYCEEFNEVCKKTDYKFARTLTLNNDELMSEWKEVKNSMKILDARERELKMVLMEKIKLGEQIVFEEEELYVRQNSNRTYDLNTVYETVPQHDFSRLVNLNKSAVEKYMEDNPAVKEKIENSITVNFTSPFLATRKLKNKKEN